MPCAFCYNRLGQGTTRGLCKLKKRPPVLDTEQDVSPASAVPHEAEQGHISPVQDNSPQQPGGWFARFFAEARPRGLAARVRAVRRAAAVSSTPQSEPDRYLRLRAEMENLKKRAAKERENLHRYALEDIMKDLLPVLDSFEKGFAVLAHDKALGQSPFAAGMRLVAEQLQKVLTTHGLQVVASCGESFDPQVHQALRREEADDVECETVGEEFAKGYLLRDRLLRPAMISVRVPQPPPE